MTLYTRSQMRTFALCLRADLRSYTWPMSRIPHALLFSALALNACTETHPAEPVPEPTVNAPVAAPVLRERGAVEAVAEAPGDPVDVEFTTSDGFTIHGTLTPGLSASPAVVLVHQLGSMRAEWTTLIERLHVAPPLTVLAIDLRGHGASAAGPDGPLDVGQFDAAQWAATSNDVLGAVAYLRTNPHGLSPQRIGLVGASIGSTAAILAAASDPTLDAIVTLSPGRAYRGVDAITPAIGLGHRHLLSLAASGEADSVEASSTFVRITTGEELVLDGNDHGVALLAAHPEAMTRVDAFLRASLLASE